MLDAWIDFDGNGTFDNTEQIFKNTAVVNGVNTLRIITPVGTSSKTTWARFRISDAGDLEPTGIAIGGEVEDYQVQIINVPLPTPQNDSFSVNEDEVLDTTTALSNPSLMDNDVIPAANFLPIQFFVGQQLQTVRSLCWIQPADDLSIRRVPISMALIRSLIVWQARATSPQVSQLR